MDALKASMKASSKDEVKGNEAGEKASKIKTSSQTEGGLIRGRKNE
jgi:hypothetical protein